MWAGTGLIVEGLGKMPWDAPLAQISLSYLHTEVASAPPASELCPPPALHFPKRRRDEVGNRRKGGMEGAESIPLEITPRPAVRWEQGGPGAEPGTGC